MTNHITSLFNPIQDGFFGGCSRMRRAKKAPSLKSITHILQWWNLTQLYLIERISKKKYESRDIPLKFCWNHHFFTRNYQILLYQEIQILVPFWYIIPNSFNFSWVFRDFFDKHGQNFDDTSKNVCPRPS